MNTDILRAPVTPAPTVRTPELDEVMAHVVVGLRNAYEQHIDPDRPPLTPALIVDADTDAHRIARYLGVTYPGQKLDRLTEWQWVLAQAEDAGLVGA